MESDKEDQKEEENEDVPLDRPDQIEEVEDSQKDEE